MLLVRLALDFALVPLLLALDFAFVLARLVLAFAFVLARLVLAFAFVLARLVLAFAFVLARFAFVCALAPALFAFVPAFFAVERDALARVISASARWATALAAVFAVLPTACSAVLTFLAVCGAAAFNCRSVFFALLRFRVAAAFFAAALR